MHIIADGGYLICGAEQTKNKEHKQLIYSKVPVLGSRNVRQVYHD